MPAYFARPDAAMSCAIIVIPESFGVNACIRQKCGDCAAEGYLAIAPDIFWSFAPGVALNPDVEAEFQKALGYFGQYDADLGVTDIEPSVRWMRGHVTHRIGGVGFYLDGRSEERRVGKECVSLFSGRWLLVNSNKKLQHIDTCVI